MSAGPELLHSHGAEFRFRYWELIFVSLLIHKLPFYLLAPSDGVGTKRTALIASMVLLLFVLYANRRMLGATVMLGGAVMNLVAVLANGGLMPVTPEARLLAGMDTIARSVVGGVLPEGSGILLPAAQTHLQILTDIIPVPVIHGVFSIGDVIMYAGGLILIAQVFVAIFGEPDLRQVPARAQAEE